MKRKRSKSPAAGLPAKRQANPPLLPNLNRSCRLIRSITQYGILKSIAGNLFPQDLLSLATSSKAAYKAVFPRKESRKSLLGRMQCDGSGIRLRNEHHRKSVYFAKYQCQEHAICGNQDSSRVVETRPCITCGMNTCDECRIHCVYQSVYQPSDEEGELPNYSGFAFLSEMEMGILSPEHLGIDCPESWKWTCGAPLQSYHDKGVLDLPLEHATWASSEPIDDILDADLGAGQLKGRSTSDSPHPSPVIQAFWDITEQRKRIVCEKCAIAPDGFKTAGQCHCTLRSRFLDRWLCIRCFQRETQTVKQAPHESKNGCLSACYHCEKPTSIDTDHVSICLWCIGEVTTPAAVPAAT